MVLAIAGRIEKAFEKEKSPNPNEAIYSNINIKIKVIPLFHISSIILLFICL